MTYCLAEFQGLIPRLDRSLLPGNAAVKADNARLTSGRLDSWREPAFVADLGFVCSGFVLDCCWRGSEDSCMHYLPARTCNSVYLSTPCDCPKVVKEWCGDEMPRYLGLPVPEAPAILSDSGITDECDAQLRAYRITYEGPCGEGGASKPSAPIKADKSTTVELDLPSLGDSKYEVTHINIYAQHVVWDATEGYLSNNPADYAAGFLSLGSGASDWFLVGTVPVGTGGFTDDAADVTLRQGRLLTTADWRPAPEGLVITAETQAGSLVGFVPNEQYVYFSERNAYHAWPRRKCKKLECRVRHVCAFDNNIIVLTDGDIYVIQDSANGEFGGSEQSPVRRISAPYPLVSTKSVVCTRSGVVFASREGVVRVTPDGAVDLVSTTHYGPYDWEQIDPASIRAAEYQGAYVFTSSRFSGVFDLNLQGVTQNLPQNLTSLCFSPDCWINDKQGRLFYLMNGLVYQFDAGPGYMGYDFESAVSLLPTELTLSAAQLEYTGLCPDEVDCEGTTVEIIGDCTISCVDQITDNCPYRINLQGIRQVSVRLRGERSVRNFCAAVDFPLLRVL